ncbi:MAG: hypothetical protein K9K66_08480 [Desulfarculaceae bacterium]|nr:hypothetical protein [Desulfarculaceae bacterium]MCF8071356.1 hypothetical protein [Desulfarculaceae bacterium]MCF8101681.1 hypothetical protein [Desulfarculaceae bacterium]MCF8116710.1 hypothetical protein [Desulfarculaceae bacterium]
MYKRRKFSAQVSPYGCFPTAVVNAFLFKGLTPPDPASLVARCQCEQLRGRIDKVKLLRGVRGLNFRRAKPTEVLKEAGIITYCTRRYINHSAFFFRGNGHAYAVNANMETSALVEVVTIRRFLEEYATDLAKYEHWKLV